MEDLGPRLRHNSCCCSGPQAIWCVIAIVSVSRCNVLSADRIPGSNHVYLEDCQVGRPARWAVDPETAERLWRFSQDLVADVQVQPGSKL